MGVAKTIETVFEALLRNKALRLLCAFALAAALVPAVASSARADEEERVGTSGGSIGSSLDTYAFDKYPALADTEYWGATYNIWAYYTPSNDEAESFYAYPEEERDQDGNFTVESSNDGVAKVVPSEGGYGFDLTFPGVGEATIKISYSYKEFSAAKEYVVKAVAEENPVSSITLSESSVDIDMPECPICGAVHECGYAYVDYEMVAQDPSKLVTQFDLLAEVESGNEDIFVSWTEDGKLVVGSSAAFQGSESATVKVASPRRDFENPNDVWATAELTLNAAPAEFSVEASPLTIELDGSRPPLCSFASDEESSAPFVFNEAFESVNAYHTGVADALVKDVSSSNSEAVGIFSYSIPVDDGVTVYFLEAKQPGTSTVTMTDILGNSHTALITVPDNSVPATGITLSGVKTAMNVGENQSLTATLTPSDSTNAVVWSSSDESVLRVSQSGVVEAVGNGSATVMATAGSVSATSDPITVTTKLTSLSLGVKSLSLSVGGNPSQLTLVFSPSTASNQNVTWSSSDDSVATVDQSGLVTPRKAGEACISATAEDGGFIVQCTVTVSQPVEGVTLDKSTVRILGADSVQLAATVSPNDADQTVIWSSSDESVATVDQSGLVTSVSAGEATITAKSADGSYSASCSVSVWNKLASVEMNPRALNMVKGDQASVSFSYMGELPGKVRSAFGWSAKDGLEYRGEDGVFVDSSTGNPVCKMTKIRDDDDPLNEIGATFEALGTGSGVIEFDFDGDDGFVQELLVSVSNPVQSVSVSSAAETLEVGQAFDLSATISPNDADDANVTWSSSNEKVASVDENGRVSAIAVGEAVITAATSNGKSARCDVTVGARDVVSTAPSSGIRASVEASSAEELEAVNGILSSLAGDGARVELVVEASEGLSGAAAAAVEGIRDGGRAVAAVLDVRFEVDGEEVAFDAGGGGAVTVRIEMTDEMRALDPNTIVVVHVGGDGGVEEMPTWVLGGYLYFKTTHFSTYAVTGSLPSVDVSESPAVSGPASSENAETVIAATGDNAGTALVVLGVAGVLSGVVVALMRRRLA